MRRTPAVARGDRRRGDPADVVLLCSRPAWPQWTTIACAGWSTSWPRGRPRQHPALGIEALTLAMDRRYRHRRQEAQFRAHDTPRRSGQIFERQPLCGRAEPAARYRRINWDARDRLRGPASRRGNAVDRRPRTSRPKATIAMRRWPCGLSAWAGGASSITTPAARASMRAGFGPQTDGLRIDCYDNPGDYLVSGMDGLEASSTATPRTSSARSPSAASWSSTATSGRPSCTAPRAAKFTSWAMPPAGR